jgi:hypothetical protein
MVSEQVIVIGVFSIVIPIILIALGLFLYSKTKGNIKILLERTQFSPGETIKGKIHLQAKKPIEVKSLNVTLRGVMKSSPSSITIGGSNKQKNKEKEIFSFNQQIFGVKNFTIGESDHSFTIKIPANVLKNAEGFAGALVNTIKLISGDTRSVYWYVDARLDIPGFDLSDRVQINIV